MNVNLSSRPSSSSRPKLPATTEVSRKPASMKLMTPTSLQRETQHANTFNSADALRAATANASQFRKINEVAINKLTSRLPFELREAVSSLLSSSLSAGEEMQRKLEMNKAETMALRDELRKKDVNENNTKKAIEKYKENISALQTKVNSLTDSLESRQKYTVKNEKAIAQLASTNRMLIDSLDALQRNEGEEPSLIEDDPLLNRAKTCPTGKRKSILNEKVDPRRNSNAGMSKSGTRRNSNAGIGVGVGVGAGVRRSSLQPPSPSKSTEGEFHFPDVSVKEIKDNSADNSDSVSTSSSSSDDESGDQFYVEKKPHKNNKMVNKNKKKNNDVNGKDNKLRQSLLRVAREHYKSMKLSDVLDAKVVEQKLALRRADERARTMLLELAELRSVDDRMGVIDLGTPIHEHRRNSTNNDTASSVPATPVSATNTPNAPTNPISTVTNTIPVSNNTAINEDKHATFAMKRVNQIDERFKALLSRSAIDPLEGVATIRNIANHISYTPGTNTMNTDAMCVHFANKDITNIFGVEMICLYMVRPNVKGGSNGNNKDKEETLMKYTQRHYTCEDTILINSLSPKSLASEVIQIGRIARVNNMNRAPAFDMNVDGCPGIIPKKVLSIPLIEKTSDAVIGTIHFLNKRGNNNQNFSEVDELYGIMYADQVATLLNACQIHSQVIYRSNLLKSLLKSSYSVLKAVLPDPSLSVVSSKQLQPIDVLFSIERVTKETLKCSCCRVFLLSDHISGQEKGHFVIVDESSANNSQSGNKTSAYIPPSSLKTRLVTSHSGIAGHTLKSKHSYQTIDVQLDDYFNPYVDIDPPSVDLPLVTVPIISVSTGDVLSCIQLVGGGIFTPPVLSSTERLLNGTEQHEHCNGSSISGDEVIVLRQAAEWLSRQLSGPLEYMLSCIGYKHQEIARSRPISATLTRSQSALSLSVSTGNTKSTLLQPGNTTPPSKHPQIAWGNGNKIIEHEETHFPEKSSILTTGTHLLPLTEVIVDDKLVVELKEANKEIDALKERLHRSHEDLSRHKQNSEEIINAERDKYIQAESEMHKFRELFEESELKLETLMKTQSHNTVVGEGSKHHHSHDHSKENGHHHHHHHSNHDDLNSVGGHKQHTSSNKTSPRIGSEEPGSIESKSSIFSPHGLAIGEHGSSLGGLSSNDDGIPVPHVSREDQSIINLVKAHEEELMTLRNKLHQNEEMIRELNHSLDVAEKLSMTVNEKHIHELKTIQDERNHLQNKLTIYEEEKCNNQMEIGNIRGKYEEAEAEMTRLRNVVKQVKQTCTEMKRNNDYVVTEGDSLVSGNVTAISSPRNDLPAIDLIDSQDEQQNKEDQQEIIRLQIEEAVEAVNVEWKEKIEEKDKLINILREQLVKLATENMQFHMDGSGASATTANQDVRQENTSDSIDIQPHTQEQPQEQEQEQEVHHDESWEKYHDDDNNSYFVHHVTGEAVWEIPVKDTQEFAYGYSSKNNSMMSGSVDLHGNLFSSFSSAQLVNINSGLQNQSFMDMGGATAMDVHVEEEKHDYDISI